MTTAIQVALPRAILASMSVSRARRNKHKRLPTVGRIVPIVAIRNRVYRELEVIAPANRALEKGANSR